MENEYNILEGKLMEEDISEVGKIKILERQKELLLHFLAESNKSIFNILKTKREEFSNPDTFIRLV